MFDVRNMILEHYVGIIFRDYGDMVLDFLLGIVLDIYEECLLYCPK